MMDNSLSFSCEKKEQIGIDPSEKIKVIVISGPTGVGKSAFGYDLCKRIDGEIVNGDALQFYKGVDIGSAKPSKLDLAKLPHHLMDICDLSDRFNVVDFYYRCRESIYNIALRKKVAVVVGGSCFYLHTLINGPPGGPPPNLVIRESLELDLAVYGVEYLYQRLVSMDEDYAKLISNRDKNKIVRALEIMKITKSKVSNIPKNLRLEDNFEFLCWFIYLPKDILLPKVYKRCEKMISNGLLKEVEYLCEKGLEGNKQVSKGIGYRHALHYMKSKLTKEDWDQFVSFFKRDTKGYIKKQLTWFKRDSTFTLLDLSKVSYEEALDSVTKGLT